MKDWVKWGLVGGLWGLISSFVVMSASLLPTGYISFFNNASIFQWVIYFPGMVGVFIDYRELFGFRIGILFVAIAILLGGIMAYLIGRLFKIIGARP